MTLAKRLLAGEHAGCASWADVARRFGANERTLRTVRKILAETGRGVELMPNEGAVEFPVKTATAVPDFVSEIMAERWPGVAEFDAMTPEGQQSELAEVHSIAPDGYHVKGVSTLYDGDGVVRARWVKTNKEQADRHADMLAAIGGLAAEWPARTPIDAPPVSNADLLCVYPLGDPHLGMLSWAQETGQTFDLGIAEHNLCAAMDRLVMLAPPAEEALVINLGDFFHSDNSSNRTARSGNALDVDSRWAKILGVGIRAMRRLIDSALSKHARVRVVNVIGNHDDHSSVFLSLALAQFYEHEGRVAIDTSPSKFHWHRFGANLLGITHGDSVKANDLPGVMACDRAKDWGETEHRFWYCGHVHHDTLKEYPGVTVETFRTLAARDAWHHGAGYRSQRDAKLDVLHRKWGRIQRHCVGIDQVCAP